jgi:hypothetical protein
MGEKVPQRAGLDGEGAFHACGLEFAFGAFPVAVDVGGDFE